MALRIVTLGGLRVFLDERELDWLPAQRMRAALFIYLTVERRAPRDGLLALFWPESDGENARHALRQSLYHLRKVVGPHWLESLPHELRIGEDVWTDVAAFDGALERGDVEAATRLYEGPFLDGVHLVDLAEWERWVDARRGQCAREFRKACRALVEARRNEGDLAGAVEAAQRWAAPDPLDDEAQHRLIQALADAGERAEAIRQYEAYERLLEPDGLRPLDETEALVERVRTAGAAWPEAGSPEWSPSEGKEGPGKDAEPARPPVALPYGAVKHGAGEIGVAPPDSPQPALLHRGPVWAATFLLGAGLLALGSAWLLPLAQGAPLEAERVVVFPLAATDADLRTSGAGWDVALAIGAAFEHSEPLRWIDAWSWLPEAQREDPSRLTPELAREITRARGARYYVDGAIRGPPDRRAVVLRLYDVLGDSLVTQQMASQAAGGDTGLSGLALRAVVGVLQPLLAPGARVDLAPIADRAPAAVALWLRGEHEYRSARFDSALDHFRHALEQDSLLVLAALKGALAAEWLHSDPEYAGLLNTAVRHDSLLPPKHRLLSRGLERMSRGDALPAIQAFHEALALDPEWVDGWMALGEAHYHLLPGTVGSPGRRGSAEAVAAFRSAVAVDSGFAPPLVHLADHAARAGQVEELGTLVRRLGPQGFAPSPTGWAPLLLECLEGGADAFGLGGRDLWPLAEASRVLAVAGARLDCAEAGFRRVLDGADERSGAAWGGLLGLTNVLLAQGRYAEVDELLERRQAAGLPGVHALRLFSTLAGAPFAAQARESVGEFQRRSGEGYVGASAESKWLLGIWHARTGDPELTLLIAEGLEREAEAGEGAALSLTWARALRGHAALAMGDLPVGESMLAELSSSAPAPSVTWSWGPSLPFERITLAKLLLDDGRYAEAYAVAEVFDHPQPIGFVALLPESLTIRARAADGLGRTRVAREHRALLAALGWPDGGILPSVVEP